MFIDISVIFHKFEHFLQFKAVCSLCVCVYVCVCVCVGRSRGGRMAEREAGHTVTIRL